MQITPCARKRRAPQRVPGSLGTLLWLTRPWAGGLRSPWQPQPFCNCLFVVPFLTRCIRSSRCTTQEQAIANQSHAWPGLHFASAVNLRSSCVGPHLSFLPVVVTQAGLCDGPVRPPWQRVAKVSRAPLRCLPSCLRSCLLPKLHILHPDEPLVPGTPRRHVTRMQSTYFVTRWCDVDGATQNKAP